MLFEYTEAFLRAHKPRCAPAAGDAVVGGRDSFYRFKELYDQGRELALQEISRKKPVLKNRVLQEIGDRGCRRNAGDRATGLRSANELRKRGLTVSSAGVRLRVAPPRPAAAQGVASQEQAPDRRFLRKSMHSAALGAGTADVEASPQRPLGCCAT